MWVFSDAVGTLFSLKNIEEVFIKYRLRPDSVRNWLALTIRDGITISLTDTFIKFSESAMNTLSIISSQQGVQLEKEDRREITSTFSKMNLVEGGREGLKKLKNDGFKIALLSNLDRDFLLGLIRWNRIERYIDMVFSIEDVRRWKPDPSVYLYSAKKVDHRTKDIFYVADTGWDIHGAEKVGYITVWLSCAYEYGIYDTNYLKSDIKAPTFLQGAESIIREKRQSYMRTNLY